MLLSDVVTEIHTSYVIFITTQMIVFLLFYIVIKHGLLNNVKCTNMTAQMIVLLLLYIVINHAWTILYLRFRQIKKRDLVHFVVACFVL